MLAALSRLSAAPRVSLPNVFALVETARQRRALARMDAAQLEDLGLTRQEALAEAARPAWDAPNHWQG